MYVTSPTTAEPTAQFLNATRQWVWTVRNICRPHDAGNRRGGVFVCGPVCERVHEGRVSSSHRHLSQHRKTIFAHVWFVITGIFSVGQKCGQEPDRTANRFFVDIKHRCYMSPLCRHIRTATYMSCCRICRHIHTRTYMSVSYMSTYTTHITYMSTYTTICRHIHTIRPANWGPGFTPGEYVDIERAYVDIIHVYVDIYTLMST